MSKAKDISEIISDANFGGTLDVDGVTNLDVVDIDGAVDMASTLIVAGNVGINTTTPVANLEIKKTVSTTGSMTDTALHLTTDATTGRKLNIGFGLGGGVANTNAAVIGFDVTNGSGATQGDLFFSTRSGTSDAVPTERMRIDSSGNVAIGGQEGTSSIANQRLLLAATAQNGIGYGLFIHNDSYLAGSARISLSPRYTFSYNTSPYIESLSESTSAAALVFGTTTGTTATERMRIHSNGVVSATAGVALGVGTANTASNVLDDYEEGTWTATLTGSTTNPSTTVSVAGTYTKIGNMCYAQFQLSNVNSTGASGGARITGLPFTASGAQATGNIMTYVRFTLGTGSTNISPYVEGTQIAFYQSTSNAGWSEITHNAGTGAYLSVSVFYKTTS